MNPSTVIGREEELNTISRLYESERSEFLAIYGRRRVGKSFLIEEALGEKISFMAVGIYQKIDPDNLEKVESYRQKQLSHFYNSLIEYGLSKAGNSAPTSWMEALELLKKLLQRKRARRKVIFIDELPWLAGPQSAELLEELGHFLEFMGKETQGHLPHRMRLGHQLDGRQCHARLRRPVWKNNRIHLPQALHSRRM